MPRTRSSKRVGSRVMLRRTTARDLEVLVKQRRSMWFDMGIRNPRKLNEHDQIFRRWVAARLRNGQVVGWIAETDEGERVAGGIVWLRPSVSIPAERHLVQPYLLSMYTEPKWRRRGLGSRIVAEAMKWAKRNHYTVIMLHASSMGKRLYARRGFKLTLEMGREL
jgi:GNAT superfamily N-acetyltransferase